MSARASTDERDLDPRTDEEWAAFERAGRLLLQRVVERHRTLRDDACFRPLPEEHERALREKPPDLGHGIEAALTRALSMIEPYGTGNLSPRFWGWVHGGGNVAGMLGQWLAASMNANVFGGAQGPVRLEAAVLDWFRDWFAFPPQSSGILLDGASNANLHALAVARHWKTSGRVKHEGLKDGPALRLYASFGAHNSIHKAAELLGLGSASVRSVATLPDGTIDVRALEAAVDEDVAAGLAPFCVVGSAGTVGVGAIDPLEALHALCRRRGLWFHVDGAIGALGFLSPRLRQRFVGLERADSLAFDFHKWGQVPYDAGCVLVRDGALHAATFEVHAGYLGSLSGGVVPHGSHAFHRYTPGLSRADRALKIWMTFQAYGLARIARVFESNVEQAQYLAARVAQHPHFVLLNAVALNIVCFRYRADPASRDASDVLHERALLALQTSGFGVLSPYKHEGRLCFRVALSNHRTRRADLDMLLEQLVLLEKRRA